MAFELAPNSAAALLAALAMIASGCVGVESIYRVVSWKTVVLIAGMLPLATALTKTGATALMANGMVTALGSLGPLTMLAVLFFVTALVRLFLSNSVDRADCNRYGRDPSRFAACICNDGSDRLLRRIRYAGIVASEYVGDGTRRLCLWRLC
jgi:hypothetical protein